MATARHSAAPLTAAGYTLRGNRPLVKQNAGPAPVGTAILQSQYNGQLRIAIEIAFGAIISNAVSGWPWTDVTSDVLQQDNQMITWTVAQQDEQTVASSSTCSFLLDNRLNKYSANNPLCSNWPNVVRSTPVRIRMSSDGGNTWYVKFQGYADGFTPTWDSTGSYSIVKVSASGILRRLNQGIKAAQSAMAIYYQSVVPDGYWSLEGSGFTTQIPSALSGGTALTLSGVNLVSFGALTGPTGSDSLPDWSKTGPAVTTYSALTNVPGGTTAWSVEFSLLYATSDASYQVKLPTWNTTGGISLWSVDQNPSGSNGFRLNYLNTAGSTGHITSTVEHNDGAWHQYRVRGVKSGSDIAITIYCDGVQVQTGTVTGQTFGPIFKVTAQAGLTSSNPIQMSLGHLAYWQSDPSNATVTNSFTAFGGYAGETPATRITRLCGQVGINVDIAGFYNAIVTMGPQTVDTFVNILRQAELTDNGFLYDGIGSGLTYQGVSQRYDQVVQLTLDTLTSDFMAPFEALDDDFRTRNSITVSRVFGASGMAEDDTGPLGVNNVGKYDTTLSVNSVDDSTLASRASWELHSGTLVQFRYPTIRLDLAARPLVGQAWLNRTDGNSGPIVPGSHVLIKNISSWVFQHPPEDLHLCAIGWTEEINQNQWLVHINCMPNDIYNVYKINDASLGRLDTGTAAGGTQSTLTNDVNVGDTTLSVTGQNGYTFVNSASFPSDFPFFILVGGIKITVSNITNVSSPQTFTVSGVTKPLPAGTQVNIWKPGVLAL